MLLKPKKVCYIEKPVSLFFSSYQQNAIIQTPTESKEWANKLAKDINSLNYNPTKMLVN